MDDEADRGGAYGGDAEWVSATDLIAYLRCPYAWWQVERGRISPSEIIGPIPSMHLGDGGAFDGQALELGPEEAGLEELLATDMKLLGMPIVENEELMIFGAPDGVDAASGALLPVGIKPSRHVSRSDELELAFHWMLLEPYRTRRLDRPTGLLVLQRDGAPFAFEIEIPASRFQQVEVLLEEVREARRTRVRPRVCGCVACSRSLRKRISRLTRKGTDLTLIYDVNPSRAAALEAIGIATYEDLAVCDSEALSAGLRDVETSLSAAQVDQIRFHALSYQEARPILFGSPPPESDAFIVLDLEYNTVSKPQHLIWLAGALVVEGHRRELFTFWADSPDEEPEILAGLARLLTEKAGLPVFTWAGRSADLPALRKAHARHEAPALLTELEARHVDLFDHARRCFRLPIPSLGLEDVATFFGVAKTSSVEGGFDAQMLYRDYRSSKDPDRRAQLKDELIAYNHDDLEALVETLRNIQALPVEEAVA